MLPFGVTITATVPQRSEIPEGLTNYPVHIKNVYTYASQLINSQNIYIYSVNILKFYIHNINTTIFIETY